MVSARFADFSLFDFEGVSGLQSIKETGECQRKKTSVGVAGFVYVWRNLYGLWFQQFGGFGVKPFFSSTLLLQNDFILTVCL